MGDRDVGREQPEPPAGLVPAGGECGVGFGEVDAVRDDRAARAAAGCRSRNADSSAAAGRTKLRDPAGGPAVDPPPPRVALRGRAVECADESERAEARRGEAREQAGGGAAGVHDLEAPPAEQPGEPAGVQRELQRREGAGLLPGLEGHDVDAEVADPLERGGARPERDHGRGPAAAVEMAQEAQQRGGGVAGAVDDVENARHGGWILAGSGDNPPCPPFERGDACRVTV